MFTFLGSLITPYIASLLIKFPFLKKVGVFFKSTKFLVIAGFAALFLIMGSIILHQAKKAGEQKCEMKQAVVTIQQNEKNDKVIDEVAKTYIPKKKAIKLKQEKTRNIIDEEVRKGLDRPVGPLLRKAIDEM